MTANKCPTPVIHALLTCDRVHTDRGTQKSTILGTMSNIATRADFPVQHDSLGVFLQMGDMKGRYSITIGIRRLNDDQALAEAIIKLEAKDRHQVVGLGFNFEGLRFPNPGKYVVRVEGNGEFLHDRVFAVRKVE